MSMKKAKLLALRKIKQQMSQLMMKSDDKKAEPEVKKKTKEIDQLEPDMDDDTPAPIEEGASEVPKPKGKAKSYMMSVPTNEKKKK